MAFVKATKKQAKARIAIFGPAGSGKTWTALELARSLGDKVAVIDTEHGSAAKYCDRFPFDGDEMTDFAPGKYIQAIAEAERAGYDVLVIDSLSHAWSGAGGLLEQADKKGGRFDAWKDLTPQHNKLIEAIMAAKLHIIATMRSKTEYVIEKVKNRNGQEVSAPRKVGLAPVQRDGMEYEFDVVFNLDESNGITTTKTRCPELSEKTWRHENAQIAEVLKCWLSDGATAPAAEPTPQPETTPPPDPIKAAKVRALVIAIKDAGIVEASRKKWMSDELKRDAAHQVESSKDLSIAELDTLIERANSVRAKGAA